MARSGWGEMVTGFNNAALRDNGDFGRAAADKLDVD
jgi:hypothetical protein